MPDVTEASFITSNYSRILARELHLQERDLPRLLQGTGLPRSVLLPGDDTRLSGAQQLRIIQNARSLNPAPELGLQIGLQLGPSSHGPIGYLALSSPDLLTALQALRDFLPLRIAIVQLGLAQSGPWLQCSMQLTISAPADEKRMLLECCALLLQSLVESITGKSLDNARFEFDFPAPTYHRLYRHYFHSPTLFSRDSCQLLLPTSLLHTPNVAGDPVSYGLARDLCQQLLEQLPAASTSLTDRVRRRLLSMPAGTAGEEDVAAALFVSKRTLARRLQREGSSYRQIRDSLYAELAARHLRESGLSVEAIAALLGYHDSANFRRAFRRWYGLSPSEFRAAE
ncbi:MAG: AraC family transcriptional regulator ligand-binding domain-containing protein [Halieaceae bacterium]|jgi:AraC-like DNA-binding protein|nr:AraC family transcriptional regulator ligand-binding domain-containing protein [Halieaceae bacterium]